MSRFAVQKIYVDRFVHDHSYTHRVLEHFPGAEVLVVDSAQIESIRASLTRNKRALHLTTFSGSFIKECPATGAPYLCCQYRILSPVVGCPIDCSYCILQHYLGSQPIKVYANWQDLFEQVIDYVREYPGQLIRIGSGELADSLALEPQLGMVRQWISFFSGLPNAILELKTKTADINWLRSIPHVGRTVIGWSLNPEEIASTEERGADPVKERVEAACHAVSWGYKVAFHFDPILTVPGWEILYQNLVRYLCSSIAPEAVAWISLGSLRYPPPLREIIRRRFPRSRILDGEWIRGMDGKTRLLKPIRIHLFRKVHQWLREGWGDDVYVYLCMESADVWRESLGWEPKSREQVEQKFQEFWKKKCK